MKYFVSFLILLLALVAAFALYKTSPKTGKTVSKRPVPFVRTVPLEPARKEVFVEAFGTVVPAQRITLQSEVAGRIIDQNPELTPTGQTGHRQTRMGTPGKGDRDFLGKESGPA
jgi:hypothetical protein